MENKNKPSKELSSILLVETKNQIKEDHLENIIFRTDTSIKNESFLKINPN